jgi:hypothetical protein
MHGATGDYHAHHGFGSIYKYNGPADAPEVKRGKQESMAKVVDRVNKKNEPEGGWSDADAVPMAFQNYRSKATLATRISNLLRAVQPDHSGDATEKVMPPALAAARLRAQHIYEAAALAAIAAVEAKKKATKEQKRKDEAAILLLLLLAGEDAYRETHTALGKAEPTATVPTPKELDGQSEQFAEQRQTVLKDFSGRLADTIHQTRDEAANAGTDPVEVAREMRRKVAKEAEVMADTEAQVTLGSVQLDRLKRAGFTSAIWMTQDDERVRPTHVACGEQGPVQLGKPFSNGLLYPGDPAGPASEVINCRCWLVGASRQSHSLQATAHDVSGEKRDETGKWTAGDFHAKTNDELSKMNARDHWKLWKEHEDAPGEYKIWMFADEYEPGVKGKFRTFKSKESFQKWFDEWPIPVSGRAAPKERIFYRSGQVPESYNSVNQVKQKTEGGVSAYYTPQATSMAGGTGRKWYSGKGIQVGVGSDEEPLVIPTEEWKEYHRT